MLFSISQSLGGLVGSTLLGTFQVIREKFHSHEIVQSIVMTDPLVAQRIGAGAGSLGGVIGDPAQRGAQGAALLARTVAREANILAYNDVFLLVGVLAVLGVIWGLLIRRSILKRGEGLAADPAAAGTAGAGGQGRQMMADDKKGNAMTDAQQPAQRAAPASPPAAAPAPSPAPAPLPADPQVEPPPQGWRPPRRGPAAMIAIGIIAIAAVFAILYAGSCRPSPAGRKRPTMPMCAAR